MKDLQFEARLEAMKEDMPGPKLSRAFNRSWPNYRRWFVHNGLRFRPTYLASRRALRMHMPELLPTYDAVVETAGGGDLEARLLSMWCPPFYMGGCSQAILTGAEPALIRSYEYGPRHLEGLWLASRFNGRRVLAMADRLWGVLDGMNEDGLVVSLSFGGREAEGQGFGIPVVLRYVLEIANTTAEAVEMLRRIPVHMSFSIAVIDRKGKHATVHVNPDRQAEVVERRVSTNHQHGVEWALHAKNTKSVEREAAVEKLLAASPSIESVISGFLRPPVYQTHYGRDCGTLYTAVYRPLDASVELVWPGSVWRQSCANFQEEVRIIRFSDGE
ncbi:C45 family autoproteolytic acyltransferase/hydolase [Rhizobium leguminosarum]|uniref:C45 family autoproteolytic acyltransferase/hydolase n=1 Tax=Rhizobium leguminosarum TaxID=384 RepID=UPI001AEB0B55|nr:C45 family peptidase [Rhizobium leguminosarum]MBP2444199.1 putative choloylglycine hydrolase [Rhizobium leguminosarum]